MKLALLALKFLEVRNVLESSVQGLEPTGADEVAFILFVQHIHHLVIPRISTLPNMPELGSSCHSWSRKLVQSVEGR
jgi:hypothetical protein